MDVVLIQQKQRLDLYSQDVTVSILLMDAVVMEFLWHLDQTSQDVRMELLLTLDSQPRLVLFKKKEEHAETTQSSGRTTCNMEAVFVSGMEVVEEMPIDTNPKKSVRISALILLVLKLVLSLKLKDRVKETTRSSSSIKRLESVKVSVTEDVLETRIDLTQSRHVNNFVYQLRAQIPVINLLFQVLAEEVTNVGTTTKHLEDARDSIMEAVKAIRTTSTRNQNVSSLVGLHLLENFVFFQRQKVLVLASIQDGSTTTRTPLAKSSHTQDVKETETDSLTSPAARRLAIKLESSLRLRYVLFPKT